MSSFLSEESKHQLALIMAKAKEISEQNEVERLRLVAEEIARQESRKVSKIIHILITLFSGIGFSMFLSFLFSGGVYPQTLSNAEKFFCAFPVGVALTAANIQRIALFSDNRKLINNKD